jgi:hypothetical protein
MTGRFRLPRVTGDEDETEQVVADVFIHFFDIEFPERLCPGFHVAPYFLRFCS